MALTTILRFTHTSGNTDFYDDEVDYLYYDTVQEDDRYIEMGTLLYNEVWSHYLIGVEWHLIKIGFKMARQDGGGYDGTLTRLEELYDRYYYNDAYSGPDPDSDDPVYGYGSPEVMKCYYEYAIEPTNLIHCQMNRHQMRWPYFSGANLLDVVIDIDFYEAVPWKDGVAVHTKRIGV